MYALLLRTLIIYFCVLLSMRLMGKRQLGELQPSELVSTILISNLASLSIESADTPLWTSLVPLFLITIIEILNSLLVLKFPSYARLVLGMPKIIIRDGVIDQDVLVELRMRTQDLLEGLRGQEIYDLQDVAYAVVETNGTIHAAKKPDKESVTREDLSLPQQKIAPVLPFWLDGEIISQNLSYCGKTDAWMEKQIHKKHMDPTQLLAVFGDEEGITLWIEKKGAQ